MSTTTTHDPAGLAGGHLAPPEFASRNRALNETHSMSAMRARAGLIVTGIENRRRRLIAERVRRMRPKLVVDVGCEDGWIAAAYADAADEILLADLDPDVLAASPLADAPHVRTVVADALRPDALHAALGGRKACVIVLSALLEHLPEPSAALAALVPLLTAEGRFVIYLPADGPILFAKGVLKHARLSSLVPGLSLEPAPGHLHRFTRRDVARLLAPHGAIEEITFDPVCLGYVAVLRSA